MTFIYGKISKFFFTKVGYNNLMKTLYSSYEYMAFL